MDDKTKEIFCEIANRASNFMDADAAEWMPSIYKIACEAAGEDPWPLLEAGGWKRTDITVAIINADSTPPEASFDNCRDMLNWLNDEPRTP